MLETHDPDWQAKWDRAHAMMRELEVRDWSSLTPDDRDRLSKLRRLLPVIFDAKHRTPNDYIQFHLSLTLRDAARDGLVIDCPRLPDDAGIDAAHAAVAETVALVERDKRRAQAEREPSGAGPARLRSAFSRPRPSWWATWRSWLRGK